MKQRIREFGPRALWVASLLCGLFLPRIQQGQSSESITPLFTNKLYSASGKWVRAANTNCLVWNSFPREGESVTWTGGVLDGKATGEGTIQWFTNGVRTSSYNGAVRAGLADGRGIAKSAEVEYEGDWSKGILTCTNAIIRYSDGNWYKGEVKDGFKSGSGEELMKGGVRYIGEFKNDRFNGKGEMLMSNGDRIWGEWRDSKIEGLAIYRRKAGGTFKVRQTKSGIEQVPDGQSL